MYFPTKTSWIEFHVDISVYRMEVTMKLLFVWISFTITTVQQQPVLDPCPSFASSSSTANMCQSGVGEEDYKTGHVEVDSVALRITTPEDNCLCQVYLLNQTDQYNVFMKYYTKSISGPDHINCWLAIDISISAELNKDESLETIQCTNRTSARPIFLKQNEMLNFKSTLIDGTLTSEYCFLIFRRSNGMTTIPSLHIKCNQVTTNKTSYSPIIKEDANWTLYVIIGASAGGFTSVIAIAVVTIYTWRKRNNSSGNDCNDKEQSQMKSVRDPDYDSEGLKRNILYQSREQCDITDGNYHTVELEDRQEVDDTQNIDGDYISIDENFSSNSKYKSKPGIQLKYKTHVTKEELGYKVEHVAPGTGNDVEYTVVNKRDRLGENTEPTTSMNNEYAVVDKSGRQDKNLKPVTPENGSNVEYAVVEKNTQI
ncbi:uncharacterized protein LOC143049426 [Mytilus galloprovincialis]|uniref:uncharacterized protein LOC143049426 n=1 Tax=Mytilus galloprovincialis TaxID=29158 RepID=UPI003F7C05A7